MRIVHRAEWSGLDSFAFSKWLKLLLGGVGVLAGFAAGGVETAAVTGLGGLFVAETLLSLRRTFRDG
jgi:hypothetical protein